MSRDDYISKLFIKNQDKLNEAPSDDFWSKLESQLDQTMPVVNKGQPRIIAFSRYLAAASVIFAVFSAVYLLKFADMQANETLAMEVEWVEPLALLVEEPIEEDVLASASMVKEEAKAEEQRQEEKIVAVVKNQITNKNTLATKTVDQIKIGDIKIVDNADVEEGNSVILIEPEMEPQPAAEPQNTLEFNNDLPQVQQSVKYANLYSQTTNSENNNRITNKVLSKAIKDKSPNKKRGARGGGFGIVKNTKNKIKKAKPPMASAHPRLQPFGFLLGKWVDDFEMEGKSHEYWTLKNATTLVGKGYKLNGKERIFEEIMRLEFRVNQIFLVISLDENNHSIDYMMTEFDTEHFTFTQKESKNYPDKVVIQKSLEGFSTIILNNINFLTADQQRYLENRNRVSNRRSIRTMRLDY